MLVNLLLTLATLAAVVAAVAGILYPFKCKALERHLDTTPPEYAEDEQGYSAWYKQRWSLDTTRGRTALWGLGGYVVGLFSLIPIMDPLKSAASTSHLPTILILVLTGSIWIIAGRSFLYSNRQSALDLKRRYPYGRQ
jgi:hypothetical protein